MTQQIVVKKPLYCRNECGTEITFDNRKSKSGRYIPISVQSGLPHQCPKSPYAQKQQQEPRVNEDILSEVLYEIQQLRKEIRDLVK